MTTALPNPRRLLWSAVAAGTAGLALAGPAIAQNNPYCRYPYYNAYYCEYYSYYDPYGGSGYAEPYAAPYDYYAYDYGWTEPWIGLGVGGWDRGHFRGNRWAHAGGGRSAGVGNGEHFRAAGHIGGAHANGMHGFFGGGSGPAGAGLHAGGGGGGHSGGSGGGHHR